MAEQSEPSGGKSQLGGCSNFPDPFECAAIREYSRRLGLCITHGSGVGVCLPSRNDHVHILGGIRLRRAMPITHRVVSTKRVMRATMPRTLGAFSICMEMYGSGRRTGRRNLRTGAQTDPLHGAASGSLGSYGVVPGTSTGRPCVRPAAPTTPRATATTGSASVSVSNSSELGTEG